MRATRKLFTLTVLVSWACVLFVAPPGQAAGAPEEVRETLTNKEIQDKYRQLRTAGWSKREFSSVLKMSRKKRALVDLAVRLRNEKVSLRWIGKSFAYARYDASSAAGYWSHALNTKFDLHKRRRIVLQSFKVSKGDLALARDFQGYVLASEIDDEAVLAIISRGFKVGKGKVSVAREYAHYVLGQKRNPDKTLNVFTCSFKVAKNNPKVAAEFRGYVLKHKFSMDEVTEVFKTFPPNEIIRQLYFGYRDRKLEVVADKKKLKEKRPDYDGKEVMAVFKLVRFDMNEVKRYISMRDGGKSYKEVFTAFATEMKAKIAKEQAEKAKLAAAKKKKADAERKKAEKVLKESIGKRETAAATGKKQEKQDEKKEKKDKLVTLSAQDLEQFLAAEDKGEDKDKDSPTEDKEQGDEKKDDADKEDDGQKEADGDGED